MGANTVDFKFSYGTIENGKLKSRMEENISSLLSEINRAASEDSPLNLTTISIESIAKTRLVSLWEYTRFVCDKSFNISKCLNDFQGYQVRAIPITMMPNDSSYNNSLNREITVSLNKEGVITGIRLAMESQEDVSKIMFSQGCVTDVRQRREILKWIEDYMSFYAEKNIRTIEQIFSDDILIIKGSEIIQRKSDREYPVDNGVKYKVLSKESHLRKISKIFSKSEIPDFVIDNISVNMHGAKPNIYGVTLHQSLRINSYADEGWLFLIWDFNNGEHPIIYLRELRESNEPTRQIFLLGEDADSWFIP